MFFFSNGRYIDYLSLTHVTNKKKWNINSYIIDATFNKKKKT